jgi:site-specific DNA recombinase
VAVGVYLRVSTEEQRERQSIVTQREFGTRYCDLHSLPIHEMYADDGVSGTVAFESRLAASRVLADARKGKFDQLLVFKLDRLGRDTRLILNAVAELEKHGVRVRSMTEEFDTATATGRLMLTMLSGFAAHERELIRERSMAGTNRRAEAGAWLGGIVPYGYRKDGEKNDARLVVCDEKIPGFDLSEADVVRLIYGMSAKEKKSCQKIADHLNRTGIPCTSNWRTHGPASGKRNRHQAAIWRPSHVRNMMVSRTYMGEHRYGKRASNKNRRVIVRAVPAIVSDELWQTAQQVLRSNRIMCKRNQRTPYMLKGLIKCGLCGLTFAGLRMKPPQRDHYYRCNGRQQARGLYGLNGKKCPAKSLNGDYVERLVWADIEAFLRDPGEILERLRERLTLKHGERQSQEKELDALRARLEEKAAERDRMLGLFRRGRIDDATLDQHLNLIDAETAGLQAEIEVAGRALSPEDRAAQLSSAESLLATLRKRLAAPISEDLKRRIVEVLVEKVMANTVERWGVQQSEITITYRFSQPNEPAILVLPKSHKVTTRNRVPDKLETIGDHLLRRRLALKLLQRQVGQQVGVNKASIANWEANRTEPSLEYIPAIIRFLGYDPAPQGSGWAERLVQCRKALGITQKEAAKRIGVDSSTLARWERGEREPEGDFAARANHFLRTGEQHWPVETSRTAS